MHVVHVYKDVFPPVPGGIEKHIDQIRRALPDVQTDVLVCARSRHGRRRRCVTGLQIETGELGPRPWSVPIAPGFPRALRNLEADVVHVHMPNPLGELAALLDKPRPLVCSYHADIVRQARATPLYRPLVHACFKRAATIIVGTRRLRETSPFLGGYASLTTVIPYFLDTDRYSPKGADQHEVSELEARYPRPVVLCVGRLVHYKGLDILIDAARQLDASVVVVGDGPLAPELHRLAQHVRNVHFVGQVSERSLLSYFAIADCFVLPSTSRAESFGIAVLEAQAMGVPAVVTDVGTGTIEAIAPGETGLVVAPGDAVALAAAVREILDDPARRDAMGISARDRAVRLHSMPQAAEQLMDVYERAVAARA